MKSNLKIAIFYVVLIAAIIIGTAVIWQQSPSNDPLYSDVISYFKNEQVKSFVINPDNTLEMQIVEKNEETGKEIEKSVSYELRDYAVFYNDLNELILAQYDAGIIESYDMPPAQQIPWWVSLLPYAIIIIIIIALWIYVGRQAAGGKGGAGGRINSFGKSRAKVSGNPNDKNKVYFSDVAGADEEKEELVEIVEFLRDPSAFTKLGAKIPHGVLLMGPPGTGKTLLAKAVAGEAGVPFFSISGSDFVEMYVGVGASRVRDLFDTAKKAPAAIIFIDEIDAVGRHRGAGLGGGHDEREQTLNQLLVEMDGFSSNDGIIVIAATNRPDILDPALLRPGRFDRQITVNYPDIKGREDILKVHSKNKPLEASVDLATIAKMTSGFTGADLANLLNEAALLAARREKSLIGMDDIEDAFTKVIAGPQKRSMKIKESEKRKTAFHEAGHAVASYMLPHMDPVHQISIIPSGQALGYTLNLPTEDQYSVYKQQLLEKITMLLAGRGAEEIIFDDISGGASNDIERATETAKKMVTKLGMSDVLGPLSYGQGGGEVFLGRDFSSSKDYSEETASKIDAEIAKIVTTSYERAKNILRENIEKLKYVAEYLVHSETMTAEQFKAVMEKDSEQEFPTFEALDAMIADKKKKSEEENIARKQKLAEEQQKRDEERAKAEAEAQNAHDDRSSHI